MKLAERFNYKITGIYKIENLITKKVYIGQAKNICARISQHLNSAKSKNRSDYNYPLHRAFRKYGIDNFSFEVLEICVQNKLNEAELYWIKKYNSCISGYNQTKGGYQSIRHIKLTEEQVDEIKFLLQTTSLSYKEICQKYNICKDSITKINSGKLWHDNTINYPIRKEKVYELKYKFKGTCILKIDKITGKILDKYVSRNAAADSLGNKTFAPHIGEVLRGVRDSAYGYKWVYEKISKKDWLLLLEKYLNKL